MYLLSPMVGTTSRVTPTGFISNTPGVAGVTGDVYKRQAQNGPGRDEGTCFAHEILNDVELPVW